MEQDRRWNLIQYKLQEYKIVKTFELFRKHNIEPILIKGWAAARFYPQKEERLFVDTDIAVAPNVFERAEEVLKTYNGENLTIDLHRGLRHLDTLEWERLFDDSQLLKIDDTDIRILSPEDHLRILCVHWLNDGGEARDRLKDIFYAVENRPSNFDWDRALNSVDGKRRKWIFCVLGLTHIYLGLDLQNTPAARAHLEIPNWVIRTVEKEWASGIRLKSLQQSVFDRKELYFQIKKRLPPNPIQATVEMNGDFDNKTRIFYQTANFVLRLKPSLEKFIGMLKRRES